MLQDIAVLTGGSFISEETGRKLDSVTPEDCGRADTVRSDKDNTSIIGGKGDKKAIDGRVATIRREIDKTTSDFDREKLEERLAKLSGRITSYNVCYTKLLRARNHRTTKTMPPQPYQAKVSEHILLSPTYHWFTIDLINPHQLEFQAGQFIMLTVPGIPAKKAYSIPSTPANNRITSYNVCYTKLLRGRIYQS